MTETFDAVLAEALALLPNEVYESGREVLTRLAAARAAEVGELRKDRERLDWLADRNNPIGNVQLPTVCVMNNMDSMRGAIDEAMRLDPELWAAISEQAGERENATKESAHED
jgi:hypothetical protein